MVNTTNTIDIGLLKKIMPPLSEIRSERRNDFSAIGPKINPRTRAIRE
jgi:hypothetical protein